MLSVLTLLTFIFFFFLLLYADSIIILKTCIDSYEVL